jgi:hypothetical protein
MTSELKYYIVNLAVNIPPPTNIFIIILFALFMRF